MTETVNYPGRFIVIEGVDGSGKTTVTEYIAEILSIRGKREAEVRRIAVPTKYSKVGSTVRKLLGLYGDQLSHPTQVELMNLCFLQAAEQIQFWLEEGHIVLCDRWIPSFLTYQSSNKSFSPLTHSTINGEDYSRIPVDLTIYLDADIETLHSRLERRGMRDALESNTKLLDVKHLYTELSKKMAEEWNWHTVDSSVSFWKTREKLEAILIENDFIWSRQ